MIEIKSISNENSFVKLFIDGKDMGDFPTRKRAQMFVDELSKKNIDNNSKVDNILIEAKHSGIVSQKTDEVKQKRRGRPKKADKNDGC